MDEVQKHDSFKCNMPSAEPFRTDMKKTSWEKTARTHVVEQLYYTFSKSVEVAMET
jgi:hypothetical protein